MSKNKIKRPRVLLFDIETAPIIAHVWSIWEQNVGLNMIKKDWHVLSWAAKWLGTTKIMYQDQRKAKVIEDDSLILKGIWELLEEADVVITQNGKKFDVKKLNARFIYHGFKPPAPFKHIDTLVLAKKHFAFTSNKLEYLAKTLKAKTQKMSRREFDGFDLWKECLAGNKKAWAEMEKYNKADVLALEEVYKKLIPWDSSINFNLYNDDPVNVCKCGSTKFHKRGFFYTSTGKYQRMTCVKCGAHTRENTNLLTKEKIKSLKRNV
jgi:DNA polymerase elongation subunit (family B)